MSYSLTQHRSLSLSMAALAVIALWGCADSSPAPPAPPPFRPQQIVVNLGESGESVTLTTTQAGGYTKESQPFTSGTDVTAANGSTYKLTLEGGRWTAAYVAPDPQQLPLGISGTTVAVARQEDGSFAIDGEAVASGQVVPSNLPGVEYTLTLGDDGQWTATYAPPPAETVSLGSSGQAVAIVRQEDGSYLVNDEPVGPDSRYVASDGRAYILLRTVGGEWIAEFVPTAVEIPLGSTGESLTVTWREDGSVTYKGTTTQSGDVVVADSGASYRLTLSDGTWSAQFVPSDNHVALGRSGAMVNLVQQEDGTFLLNGRRFSSGGTHTAGNGSVYRLTYSDGAWTSEYLAPPPFMLQLGTSGETISIERGEVGTYSANGQFVASGSTYTAGNGSSYALTQVGEAWIANYRPPEPAVVKLGESGLSIRIERLEDGTYHSGGTLFKSSMVFTAINGRQYRVTLDDGVWSAVFEAPPPTVVTLGTSGHTVELTLQEGGGYKRGEDSFESGDTVTTDDGDRYRLTLSGEVWTATFLPPPTTSVALGTNGQTVTLTENADGSYEVEGQRIQSGDTFTTDSGSTYRLTLSNGMWTADFVAGQIVVPLGSTGGTVTLTLTEDGSYERNGRRFRSGQIVVYLDLEYRLDFEDDEWSATLVGITGTPVDPGDGSTPSTPDIPTDGDRIEISLGVDIGLRESGESTVSDEGTILVIQPGKLDLEYTIDDLTSSSGVLINQTHVDAAQAQLEELLDELNTYEGLYDVEVVDPDDHIRTGIDGEMGLWDRAQEAVERVFGNGSTPLDSSPWSGSSIEADEVEDVREELQAAIKALSDIDDFEDFFSDQFDEDDPEDFFESPLSRIRFGGSGSTRYGAYAAKTGSTSALDGDWSVGVFAYSPLEQPATSELPDRGGAIYKGDTVAVDSQSAGKADAPDLYTGDIELIVRFSTGRVDGTITNLEDENGDPWTYVPSSSSDSENVEAVHLPTAALAGQGSFGESSGTATVQFPAGQGLTTSVKQSSFHGQFVDEDDEAFGTYEVATLSGAFGVDFSSSQSVDRPDIDDDGDVAETSVSLEPDDDGLLTLDDRMIEASEAYSRGGSSETGDELVDIAIDELDDARDDLEALVASGSNSSSARKTLWGNAVTALERVFSTVPSNFGSSFPSGTDADEEAEDRLDDAIYALGSESRFLAAQDSDEIFDDSTFTEDEISDIFDAYDFKLELEFGHTDSDYTRFGAWASVTQDVASEDPKLVTGTFAYSPLAQTNFYSAGSPYDFRAVYEGETLAVSTADGTLYEGDFQLAVTWEPGSSGTNSISAFVEDLRTVDGSDLLQYGGLSVRYIQFYGVTANSTGLIGFDKQPTVTIRYEDARIDDTELSGTHSLEGKFVGDSIDGPLGVIGAWDLDASSGIGMKGAFGAELLP